MNVTFLDLIAAMLDGPTLALNATDFYDRMSSFRFETKSLRLKQKLPKS